MGGENVSAREDENGCREVGGIVDFKVPRAVHFRVEFPVVTLDKVAENRLRELADELAGEACRGSPHPDTD